MNEKKKISIEKLKDVIEKVAAKASSYMKGETSNQVESINSSIAATTPKSKDFSSSYNLRADLESYLMRMDHLQD